MKLWLAPLAALSFIACSGSSAPPTGQTAALATIPVTSKSPQALERFQRGRDLLDNLRFAEAAEEFNEALKLDPNFVSARALHGVVIPGPDGLRELERAAMESAGLPQAEKVFMDVLLANRQGDFANSENLWKQLVTIAPGDWRAQQGLGIRLLGSERYDDAAQAFRKATELNPKAGPAFNMLGYASLRQGNVEPAIEAFKQYVAVNPQEPNAQDSLGEALLAAGRFPDAEAAFRKAIELSPRFWNAWDGIAYTKFFAGDGAGAREALTKARAAAERRADVVVNEEMFGWIALAERKTAEALKALDAAEKVEGAQSSDVALVPVHRAIILADGGRNREAIAQVSAVLERADKGEFPPGLTRTLRRDGLVARAIAELGMKDVGALEKTAGALAEDASSRPDDAVLQSSMHLVRGLVGLAKNDLKEARMHFDACSAQDAPCQWQRLLAAQKGGDRATADAVRASITRLYLRDPGYLYVRSRLNQLAARQAS